MKQLICAVCGQDLFTVNTGPSGQPRIRGEKFYWTSWYSCETCKSMMTVQNPLNSEIKPDQVYVLDDAIIELAFKQEGDGGEAGV